MFEIKLNPMFDAVAVSFSNIFIVGYVLRLKGFNSGFRAKKKEINKAWHMTMKKGWKNYAESNDN